ncbi:hypothetical protein H0H92_005818 [Tricholoma furcatifolium]|nr:hypothetical protein H0H92_005818 [Tricholoma furcatifolium]
MSEEKKVHVATLRTAQGLSSHLAQVADCHKKHAQKYVMKGDTPMPACTIDASPGPCEADMGVPMDLDTFFPNLDLPEDGNGTVPGLVQNVRPSTVEDIPDEDPDARWIKDYPGAGKTYGQCTGAFERARKLQEEQGEAPWSPFRSHNEWKLAEWLISSGVSQNKINDFLNLSAIQKGVNPLFHNSQRLLQLIDSLPCGAKWTCTALEITGDEKDENGKY